MPRLALHFPDSAHVSDLGLGGARDSEIWVRLGNAATAATVEFFLARVEVIKAFANDEEAGFLALA